MGKKLSDSEKLREILSFNIKKQRKKLGLTQEKLAEAADLSSQTINDIEGCRMWVSDKTITKLASVLHVKAYQLLVPPSPAGSPAPMDREFLYALEEELINTIRRQFSEVLGNR